MRNTKQLLLIEDSRDIAAALKQVLAAEYIITHSENGRTGLQHAAHKNFDAIILDLKLPEVSGLEICKTLRAEGCATPILILTGDGSVLSKIRLLDAGADDYITKPFSLGELKARLRVLHRRHSRKPMDMPLLSAGNLTLDRHRHIVERDGQAIKLRRKEFVLLECLIRHADSVVTRSALGNYAWHGNDVPWTNTIDVHIKHLRDKIDRPFETSMIKTVHGIGYKLVSEERTPVAETIGR